DTEEGAQSSLFAVLEVDSDGELSTEQQSEIKSNLDVNSLGASSTNDPLKFRMQTHEDLLFCSLPVATDITSPLPPSPANNGKPETLENLKGVFAVTGKSVKVADPAQQLILGGLTAAYGFNVSYTPPANLKLAAGESIVLVEETESDGAIRGSVATFDAEL